MASRRLSDRKLSLWTFVIFTIAFHKYTHEGWRVLLESIGFRHGLFGNDDWLGNFRTASERAVNGWLADYLIDADQQVLNRITQNSNHGIFSAGISLDTEGRYTSQIGLGGWLLSLIPSVMGMGSESARFTLYSLTAVLSALIATLIMSTSRQATSRLIPCVVGALLLQPWVLAIASTPNLVIGLRVLPALWVLHALSKGTTSVPRLVVPTLALAVLGYTSGYDWATTVPAMAAGVVVYWSIRNSWSLRKFLTVVSSVICATVGAMFITVGLHLVQLWSRFHSWTAAWVTLTYPLSKRAGANLQEVTHPLLLEARRATPDLVMDWYLGMPALFPPVALPGIRFFSIGILIAVCLTIFVVDLFSSPVQVESTRRVALGASFAVTLLGPLGWFLLFRPSAYIHTHLDGAIWYLPTIPLGFAFIALRVTSLRSRTNLAQVVAGYVALTTILAVVLLYVISSLLVAR